MIVVCAKCQRQRPPTDNDTRLSHTYCARCYVLFPELNGGIDWQNATPDEISDLKKDISTAVDKETDFMGEPQVEWPEGGLKFVDELVSEVLAEREVKDGKRL